MKKVVLIGDSIRHGYEASVRAELTGWAEVWSPEQNGGNSERVLTNLESWALTRQSDVIHLNCGLHDLKKEFGSDASAVPLDQYKVNLRKILTQLQERTGATIVWAQTTPVNEVWHHATKGFDRFEADVVAYNAASLALCQELGIAINDLYAFVTQAGRDELLVQDGVHFSPAGYALLGKQVADRIRQVSEASVGS